MDRSFPGESSLDQIIISRIRAAVANLVNAREEIKKEGIKGDTDDSLKRLLEGIIEKVDKQIELILQEIQEIKREDVKRERSDRIHRNLEGFLYDVDLIRTASLQIPVELYYFTKAALGQLGHKDVKVAFISGTSLGTTNLSENLKNLFEFFEDICTYIDSAFPFYWIILTPPSLTMKPLNWPLIAHEIGHILEIEKWQFVKKYYAYPVAPSLYQRDLKAYYAQEFQADFVAVSYFGPIFAHRLLAIYDTGELVISLTHPPRRERFTAIAEKLQGMGFSSEANALRRIIEREEFVIGPAPIEHLNEIISETARVLEKSNSTYIQDCVEAEKAKNRLTRFAAYTDNMRILVNVAREVLEGILQSTSDPARKRELETDFDYLLIDSIRLTYIKQISQRAFSS